MIWRRWLPAARRAPLLEVAEGYARWAPSYPREAANELMRLEQREMSRLLPEPLRGRRAVDLGCGSGRYLRLLAQRGASPCVGLDSCAAMLARCRDESRLLVRGELGRLPLRDACFDVAVCGLVLGHLQDLEAALAEIARVLRPGGVLLYSDVHPEGARHGWARTFEADAREYAIRHFVHTLERHRSACAAAGILVEETAEPDVEDHPPWRGTPAVLVVRGRREAAGGGASARGRA